MPAATPRYAHKSLTAALGIALALTCTSFPALAAAQDPGLQYSMPRQPLASSLNELAAASDRQILFNPTLIGGESAPALSGRYSFEQAMDRLLASTRLTYRITSTGVVTILQREPEAAPQPQPPPPPAAVEEQAPPEPTEMSAVQVTGSRIKRAEIEGPSPVTVVTAQQIEAEGHATVFDALESLVMASGAVETELSGGFSANAHPLNLRGLGPGRSLLLIDGRRAADYPFPYGGNSNFQNFGNIPSGAVERIEILAGGASAIYGADAVSGVVNVVLKRGYEGDEIKLRAGTSTMGGRDRFDLQWAGGKTGEQWGLTYAFQYYSQEILYGTQRDHWDPRRDPLADPRTGVVADTGLRMRLGADSSSRPLWQFPEGTCEQWGGDFHDTPYLRISGGQVQNMGNYCGYWGDARNESLSKGKNELAGYLFGTWDFSPELEGWASLQAWRSKATSHGGFESITGPHTDGVGRIGAFYDPQFGMVVGIDRYLTPFELGGIGAMDQHYKEYSVDVAAGLRGSVGRFDWDVTLSHAEYYFERNRRRLIGNRVNDWFFGEQQGTTSNGDPIYRMNLEHWLRPMTAAEYASLSTTAHYEAESWVDTASFVVTGDLFDVPAGPVGSALVLEASRQGYDMESEPRALPGVTELYNLTTTNGRGDRDRYAVGIEFSIPLHSTLKASLAGRYDKYNDITNLDDAKTWNAGLEWRPVDSLLVRGSYATSFKAPDMHWIFNEGSGSFGTSTDAWHCIENGANPRCEGYDFSVLTLSQGDPGLEEETGKSWSAGFVWDIVDGMSVNVDYWNIELNGAIERLAASRVLADEAGCVTGLRLDGSAFGFAPDSSYCREVSSRVTRIADPDYPHGRISRVVSGPINQSYMRVKGIDAGYRWRLSTERLGRFTFGLDWSHTLEFERQQFSGDPVQTDWRDDPENLNFRSKAKALLNWRGDDWTANLSTTRYGSLPKLDSAAGRTGVHFLWNANVGKEITDQAALRFYVNNLFNNLHPEDETNDDFPFFYDSYSPIGREVMAQFEFRFD